MLQITIKKITIKKISLIGLLVLSVPLTACSKSEPVEKTSDNLASTTEAIPMSAAPADENNAPAVINDGNAVADLDSDVTVATSDVGEPIESGVDNSAMETISENDQVIDNKPASPNAPKADDNGADVNQKLQ
ncbi:hypothetical protein MOMA_03700 [Moraxella macacae 0408225]|uniref:Lipoprotein n=1 Tax=Moraxella macacae 0408225 TaxID=1230338 RepID=L2F9M9_9GAMM|nr:hypothetical protein [Moraxella macacae]ELA09476.1 hypothetical protein MOMA_03700 [Moraxella macacae 0408225]